MFVGVYLAVLGLACGASLLAMRAGVDWLTRLLGSLFATVTWGVFALQSYEVRSAFDPTVAETYQSLAWLGFAAALVMGLFTIRFGLRALREDPEQPIEPDTSLDLQDR